MNELYPVEGAPAPTPKPSFLMDSWNVLPPDAEHPYYRIRATWPGARFKIVNVLPVVSDEPPHLAEETKAVADAIGALPDLYDALESAEEFLRFACSELDGTGREADAQKALADARAALAKARGEAS